MRYYPLMGEKPSYQGTGEIIFRPVPSLFSRQPESNFILVGNDPLQVRFVEQLTGLSREVSEDGSEIVHSVVTDDDLLGKEGILYRVLFPHSVDLSPQVRNRTGVYSLAPITPGSASANALVRAAADHAGEKLDRDRLDAVARQIGKAFQKEEITDLRVGFWQAFWLLSGPLVNTRWKEPWESQSMKDWCPAGVNVGQRLGYLFKVLSAYTLLRNEFESDAKQSGLLPSKLASLKELYLRGSKVRASLVELSRWKNLGTDPRITALVITSTWLR